MCWLDGRGCSGRVPSYPTFVRRSYFTAMVIGQNHDQTFFKSMQKLIIQSYSNSTRLALLLLGCQVKLKSSLAKCQKLKTQYCKMAQIFHRGWNLLKLYLSRTRQDMHVVERWWDFFDTVLCKSKTDKSHLLYYYCFALFIFSYFHGSASSLLFSFPRKFIKPLYKLFYNFLLSSQKF